MRVNPCNGPHSFEACVSQVRSLLITGGEKALKGIAVVSPLYTSTSTRHDNALGP